MEKIIYCPFRICRERKLSATVDGEWTEIEDFMPCLRHKCPAFYMGHKEISVGCGDKIAAEKCKRLQYGGGFV